MLFDTRRYLKYHLILFLHRKKKIVNLTEYFQLSIIFFIYFLNTFKYFKYLNTYKYL